MLLQKSTLLQVAGALATTQTARAAPHPGSPTLLVRDDALPTAGGVYGFYGINEHPLISDLEFASVLPLIEDEAGGGKMRDYFQYLLGFVKCSPEWVESWIPRAEELKDSAVQEEGQGYVLPFSVKDNKRVAVAVTLGKLKEMPEIGSMFESDLKDEPDGWEADKGWWHWALLEGAFSQYTPPDDSDALDLKQIIHILSGYEVVEEKERDETKLWDQVFTKADSTPIYVQKKDEDVFNVMTTYKKDDLNCVDYAKFNNSGVIEHHKKPLNEVLAEFDQILHLKDMPTFAPGTRQGEWDPAPLDTISLSATAALPAQTK